jgi:phosphatidylinositol alpha 1,6-mannosyltransferase
VSLLVQDGSLRRRMGEAGRRAVLGRSWDVVCTELTRHYERVILDAVADVDAVGVQPPADSRAYS